MTYVGPVGTAPAGQLSGNRTIGRAGIFAGAGVLAALNAQAYELIGAVKSMPLLQAVSWLGGISAVIWLAMYAALKIGSERDGSPLSRRDLAVLCAVIILSFAPIAVAAKVALLLTGVYLFATSPKGSSARRVAAILLALTGPLLWGRILLVLFAGPILALDANIVGSVMNTTVDGNMVRFADGSSSFIIAGPCSSVHNISLAIVLWTTAAALFQVRVDRSYLLVGAAMVVWMFVLNIARLTSIGLFPAQFEYLHVGGGAEMFGWAGLIGAAALAGFGVIRAVERQQ